MADVPRNDRVLGNFSQLLAVRHRGLEPRLAGPRQVSTTHTFEPRLGQAQTNAAFIMTVLKTAGRGKRGKRLSGPELYLHDAPLERHCPALLARLDAPR